MKKEVKRQIRIDIYKYPDKFLATEIYTLLSSGRILTKYINPKTSRAVSWKRFVDNSGLPEEDIELLKGMYYANHRPHDLWYDKQKALVGIRNNEDTAAVLLHPGFDKFIARIELTYYSYADLLLRNGRFTVETVGDLDFSNATNKDELLKTAINKLGEIYKKAEKQIDKKLEQGEKNE